MGHAPYSILLKISSLKKHVVHPCDCFVCTLAKHHRLPFPTSTSMSKNLFDLVHIDIWGPYRVFTFNGFRYFLTFVDDCTRMTWTYLLRLKSDSFVILQSFIQMVHTQYSTSIKHIRSDNGSEFFNQHCSSLFVSKGIIHQSSCVHTPQQNDLVERKHRHLLEVARALKFQAQIPLKYWGDCILTATYLINRLPTQVLSAKSPFECFHGHSPSLDHIRTMGCLCYATTPNYSDKFSSKSIHAVFMGYSHTQKGYKLLNLETGTFLVNRDVIFKEHIFPFKYPKSLFLNHLSTLLSDNSDVPSLLTTSSPIPSDFHSPTSVALSLPSNVTHPASLSPDSPITSHMQSPDQSTTSASPSPPALAPLPQRKSTRSSKPSIWLTDYVYPPLPSSHSSLYPIDHFVSYSHLSSSFQFFLSAFSAHIEPSTYAQATQDQRWVQAMKLEIEALEANHTWDVVDLPIGKVPIGCKWVFKVKYNVDGSVERYKARLVAKGFTQQEGIDFDDTFSPVAKMATVRTVISLAALYSWLIFQMDVHNAFLNGDLSEEVYMTLPQGFGSQGEQPHKVYRLLKSLYGLKQASRQWNIKLTEAFVQSGFIQSRHDYSLFTKSDGDAFVVLLVYVDDLMITGNDLGAIKKAQHALHQKFKVKDLGELRYFLGI